MAIEENGCIGDILSGMLTVTCRKVAGHFKSCRCSRLRGLLHDVTPTMRHSIMCGVLYTPLIQQYFVHISQLDCMVYCCKKFFGPTDQPRCSHHDEISSSPLILNSSIFPGMTERVLRIYRFDVL